MREPRTLIDRNLTIGGVARTAGANVETILADLARLSSVPKDLIARCEERRGKVACPIIAALTA